MTRYMPTVAGWLAALTLTACASNTPTPQTGSPGTATQPTTGTEVTAGPSNPTTPPPTDQAPGTMTQVTGAVTYRERIALSPDAVLVIEVMEQTPQGAPGNVISQQTVTGPGQVPIPFSVAINPQRIRPEATYVLIARIMDGGRSFTTETPVPVLTQGHRSSDVQVLVRSGR
jgi:putative lipoprotein